LLGRAGDDDFMIREGRDAKRLRPGFGEL